jgi:hypothetical protein
MKKLEKDELKKQLTELVEQSKKIKNFYLDMVKDYVGEDTDDISDSELNKRLNSFYNFINNDYELNSLWSEFNLNI